VNHDAEKGLAVVTRRIFWLGVAAVAGVVGVVLVHFGVWWYTREEPNYSRIEDGLWLGGVVAGPPPGVRAVLNVCEAKDAYAVEAQRREPVRDAAPAPSLDWLREQVDFIEAQLAEGKAVFVQCHNGVSRSAMVVAAYLMRREKWPRERAIEYLRSRRPGVRVNPVFLELLGEWEKELRKPPADGDAEDPGGGQAIGESRVTPQGFR
jgi:hypothetical protein